MWIVVLNVITVWPLAVANGCYHTHQAVVYTVGLGPSCMAASQAMYVLWFVCVCAGVLCGLAGMVYCLHGY